ncbi:MAG: DNA translocase FtsK [Acidobacteriia bacterium]|nr:DNA translocase FtsK [Terriglobia bacterium]
MKLLSPTPYKRLNEVTGFLLLLVGLVILLSLVSYHVQDPSLDTASDARPRNLIGYPGSYLSDLFFQTLGAAAFLFPLLSFVLAWRWLRSEAIESGAAKAIGAGLLAASLGAALSFLPWRMFGGNIRIGGVLGYSLSRYLLASLNPVGALIAIVSAFVTAIYLVSSFSLEKVAAWFAAPRAWMNRRVEAWRLWMEQLHAAYAQKAAERARKRTRKVEQKPGQALSLANSEPAEALQRQETIADPEEYSTIEEIPIVPLEEPEPIPQRSSAPVPWPVAASPESEAASKLPVMQLPGTDLLNEPPGRSAYDEQELKDIAVRIKAKFEEFNVLGNVVQINPGPVVTTFEFKPEAGIKYSRITNLTEDLCLGLQAESILIERIPGKPTVGIEVPNTRRELIALRQMLESEEFTGSHSHLTIPLGKDINGRIRVAALETMPHLLIAGSTGSGKSVMINSMIMGILYKATPEEVRLIMVDPKRVELGMYEGIPHLLTPVITDPKKATNALRNAVLEMERRLRLLAEYGVRNIDQFNKKVRKVQEQPRNLFPEDDTQEDLKPLPFILILIDELADLMMLEGRNVEESVTRLAQMARAVGMHLVLATQRPSVDVITGLIKANFPARLSFRVATRVDSRTILDVMGAEHLLGKGDMLFLPPGSSRLVRLHGAFVTETEINRVVDHWKAQAQPEYDQSYLIAPPGDEEASGESEPPSEEQDPMYEEAVRLVLQMGKASTSTLQRHLRLGYGRAARILDMMQRDGIIGPPDGSKPRDVLKRPDWLQEVENQVR